MASYVQEFQGKIKARGADVESVTATGAITAPAFNGKATSAGTADSAASATKAEQDGNGVNIANNYARQTGNYSGMTVGNADSATNATNATNVMAKSGSYKSLANALLEMVYPVGSIYMSVRNTSPQSFLGGTWVAWGAGRVPVSVASGDSDFGTVEKTGGEKTHQLTTREMPRHDHSSAEGETVEGYSRYLAWTTEKFTGTRSTKPLDEYTYVATSAVLYDGNTRTTFSGYDDPHNNIQPYITCYMWKRTA